MVEVDTIAPEVKQSLKIVLCTTPQHLNAGRDFGDLPRIPNIAIISLIKWIEHKGYRGTFYDIDMLLPHDYEIFKYFRINQPDVVGLSAVVSTSYAQIKKLAKIIRKASPKSWIIIGGNMAVSAHLILRRTDIDICVLGDGEEPFGQFLDYVAKNGKRMHFEELSNIRGLAFINKDGEMEFTKYAEPIRNEDNPFPDYHILEEGLQGKSELLKNYFRDGRACEWFVHDPRTFMPHRKPRLGQFYATKGCVVRCTFCQRFSQGYHPFDINKLDEHLKELKEKYNVGFIEILGENFGLPKSHSYKVAEILKKHDMLWLIGAARCKNFTREDLEYFKSCGCTGVKFGVETGSKKIFEVMEKYFTLEDVHTALRYCHELGMWAPLAFCIAMPGETDRTIKETGEFLGNIGRMRATPPCDLYVQTFYALPLPGAALYDYAQLKGVIGTSLNDEERFLEHMSDRGSGKFHHINLTGISRRKVNFWDFLLRYEAMRTYYATPLDKKDVELQK